MCAFKTSKAATSVFASGVGCMAMGVRAGGAWPWAMHAHGGRGGGRLCCVSLCVVFCLAYLSREADAGFLLIHKAP